MPHKNTVFLFWPINCITYEIHVAIIDGPTRAKGIKHALTAVRWLFDNTKCQKLITYIPEDNPRAMTFVSLCGMNEEGRISNSWLKDGKLSGLVLYGATRQKFEEMYQEVEQ